MLLVLRQVAVKLLGWEFWVELSSIAFCSRLFAPITLFIRGFRILRILLISTARIASRVVYLVGLPSEYLLLQPNNLGLQSLHLLVFFNELDRLVGYVRFSFQCPLLPGRFPFNRTNMQCLPIMGLLAKFNNYVTSFGGFGNHAPIV